MVLTAEMVDDSYKDLEANMPYEVDKVYSTNHIRLKDNPRLYLSESFEFRNNGIKVTRTEARRLYSIQKALDKFGL